MEICKLPLNGPSDDDKGWQSAFKGIVPQPYLDNMSIEKQTNKIAALLLERRDREQLRQKGFGWPALTRAADQPI
jgi:hypothetical protein